MSRPSRSPLKSLNNTLDSDHNRSSFIKNPPILENDDKLDVPVEDVENTLNVSGLARELSEKLILGTPQPDQAKKFQVNRWAGESPIVDTSLLSTSNNFSPVSVTSSDLSFVTARDSLTSNNCNSPGSEEDVTTVPDETINISSDSADTLNLTLDESIIPKVDDFEIVDIDCDKDEANTNDQQEAIDDVYVNSSIVSQDITYLSAEESNSEEGNSRYASLENIYATTVIHNSQVDNSNYDVSVVGLNDITDYSIRNFSTICFPDQSGVDQFIEEITAIESGTTEKSTEEAEGSLNSANQTLNNSIISIKTTSSASNLESQIHIDEVILFEEVNQLEEVNNHLSQVQTESDATDENTDSISGEACLPVLETTKETCSDAIPEFSFEERRASTFKSTTETANLEDQPLENEQKSEGLIFTENNESVVENTCNPAAPVTESNSNEYCVPLSNKQINVFEDNEVLNVIKETVPVVEEKQPEIPVVEVPAAVVIPEQVEEKASEAAAAEEFFSKSNSEVSNTNPSVVPIVENLATVNQEPAHLVKENQETILSVEEEEPENKSEKGTYNIESLEIIKEIVEAKESHIEDSIPIVEDKHAEPVLETVYQEPVDLVKENKETAVSVEEKGPENKSEQVTSNKESPEIIKEIVEAKEIHIEESIPIEDKHAVPVLETVNQEPVDLVKENKETAVSVEEKGSENKSEQVTSNKESPEIIKEIVEAKEIHIEESIPIEDKHAVPVLETVNQEPVNLVKENKETAVSVEEKGPENKSEQVTSNKESPEIIKEIVEAKEIHIEEYIPIEDKHAVPVLETVNQEPVDLVKENRETAVSVEEKGPENKSKQVTSNKESPEITETIVEAEEIHIEESIPTVEDKQSEKVKECKVTILSQTTDESVPEVPAHELVDKLKDNKRTGEETSAVDTENVTQEPVEVLKDNIQESIPIVEKTTEERVTETPKEVTRDPTSIQTSQIVNREPLEIRTPTLVEESEKVKEESTPVVEENKPEDACAVLPTATEVTEKVSVENLKTPPQENPTLIQTIEEKVPQKEIAAIPENVDNELTVASEEKKVNFGEVIIPSAAETPAKITGEFGQEEKVDEEGTLTVRETSEEVNQDCVEYMKENTEDLNVTDTFGLLNLNADSDLDKKTTVAEEPVIAAVTKTPESSEPRGTFSNITQRKKSSKAKTEHNDSLGEFELIEAQLSSDQVEEEKRLSEEVVKSYKEAELSGQSETDLLDNVHADNLMNAENLNKSEAGPNTADLSSEEFQSADGYFLDLLAQKTSLSESELRKQSLFVQFDPCLKKSPVRPPQAQKIMEEETSMNDSKLKTVDTEKNDQIETEKDKQIEKLTKENAVYQKMLNDYENTITQCVNQRENDKKQFERFKRELEREKEEVQTHLRNSEIAFNDVHLKYERSKAIIEGMKANEDQLKGSYSALEEELKKQIHKYDALKTHAISQLQKGNQELDLKVKTNEMETAKLTAMLKKSEMRAASLQESLARKTQENAELTSICDDLISRVGGSQNM